MKIKPILSWSTAAAAIAGTAFCAAAGAQSLSLSYTLDARSGPSSDKAHPVVDRCSGLTWAASLAAACGPQAAPPAAPVPVAEAAQAAEPVEAAAAPRNGDEKSASAGDTFTGFALPILGSPSADSQTLRAVSGKAPPDSTKDVDLLFRFASKYRLRNGDEGWDVTRFKDVTSENRTQSSGVKGLAVELMFPFQ